MKTHELTHLRWDRATESKPFKCSYPGCNKSFTAKTSLQNHILSQHATKLPPPSSTGNGDVNSLLVVDGSIEEGDEEMMQVRKCLHSGCTEQFTSTAELREHLHENSPGITAEYNFLLQTVLQFSDIITGFDSKTATEKEAIKGYVQSVRGVVRQSLQPAPVGAVTRRGKAKDYVQREDATDSSSSGLEGGINVEGGVEYAGGGRRGTDQRATEVSDDSEDDPGKQWWELLNEDFDTLLEGAEDAGLDSTELSGVNKSGGLSSNLLAAHDSITTAWDMHLDVMLPCKRDGGIFVPDNFKRSRTLFCSHMSPH